jgi:AcrR family transcriptional regulator
MEQTPVETTNEAEARLLESALHLFAEKGYEGTSIREIIEGAGVTRPVLYYYFHNKEDVFRRLVQPLFTELIKAFGDIPKHYAETVGRLKAVMRIAFVTAESNPRTVRLILQMYFSPPQGGPEIDKDKFRRIRFHTVEAILQEGLDRGELAGGDARSLTLVFIGIMDAHVMAKSQMPGIHLTPELAEGLVDLFFYGTCYKEHPQTSLVSPFFYA